MKRPDSPPIGTKYVCQWFQHIIRYWNSSLSGSELKVLVFIFDRQLCWGKLAPQPISRSQFVKGVTGRWNGKIYNDGTGLSYSTIDAALNGLERRGIIHVTRRKNSIGIECRFSINWNWQLPSKEEAPQISGRPPRKSRNTHPGIRAQRESSAEIIIIQENQCAPCAESPHAEIQDFQTEMDREKVRIRRRSTPAEQRATLEDRLRHAWRKAHEETFPEAPYVEPKVRELGALKQYAGRWSQTQNGVPFVDYFAWCIRYWRAALHEEFRWMDDPPQLPSVFFLMRFADRFERQFARRVELKADLAKTSRQRMIDNLVKKGAPMDVAEEEADSKLGLTKQKTEIMRERAKLSRERDALHRQQNYVQTRQRFRPSNQQRPTTKPPQPSKLLPIEVIDVSHMPASFPPYENGD